MDDQTWLTERFEENRRRLRGVAYRMLGSLSEAEDAVQEAWLRLNRIETNTIENLGGWLTTVVSRVCLDMLRSRKLRREEPIGAPATEPSVMRDEATDPEGEAMLVHVIMPKAEEVAAPAEAVAAAATATPAEPEVIKKGKKEEAEEEKKEDKKK